MSTSEFDALYANHVRYVKDANHEHERLGSRQSNFEMRTGKCRSREQFRVGLERLEANPLAKAHYLACLERGFHAHGDELRERFQAANGCANKKKMAA